MTQGASPDHLLCNPRSLKPLLPRSLVRLTDPGRAPRAHSIRGMVTSLAVVVRMDKMAQETSAVSLGTWGGPECPEAAGQCRPYASSEPDDIGCCCGKKQSTHLWYMPAPKDDAITQPHSLPPLSVAVSARHVGGTSVLHKPAEFGGQVAWDAYQAQFEQISTMTW
ncbi:hypothetical protein E2C01_056175 [Portunus trituberculatus]|uniref:Uncharacterized protein n=1 Tax=Portunus trituberculatus TaxID=210409 RepID=A0A5B7GWN1_PORTR|nr:hypothetical protein [Portunus trituberculatus]